MVYMACAGGDWRGGVCDWQKSTQVLELTSVLTAARNLADATATISP